MSVTSDTISFPPSTHTVSVKILNAFENLTCVSAPFLAPAPGSTSSESAPLSGPGKAFLIEHPTGRRLVFDAGVRKNFDDLAPFWREEVKSGRMTVRHGRDIDEQLRDGGVDPATIEAIIWSHVHFDHTGDPSTFPPSVAIIIGPGAREAIQAGGGAHTPASDLEGRQVIEISFSGDTDIAAIAGLKVHDFFGDGSFFLLDAPGHCEGHMVGLARVTASPASWVLMGGDGAHHPAQLRPSPFVPLPPSFEAKIPTVLKGCARDRPFINITSGAGSVHHNAEEAARTRDALLALDKRDDVFVVLSHDGSMDWEGGIRWFPQEANGWMSEGWKAKVFWSFLEEGNPGYRW